MIDSHPCIVSEGEYLMRNATALRLFHGGPNGSSIVLDNIQRSFDARLRRKRRESSRSKSCTRMAGGVKLKASARDLLPGVNGNLRHVANQARVPPTAVSARASGRVRAS